MHLRCVGRAALQHSPGLDRADMLPTDTAPVSGSGMVPLWRCFRAHSAIGQQGKSDVQTNDYGTPSNGRGAIPSIWLTSHSFLLSIVPDLLR